MKKQWFLVLLSLGVGLGFCRGILRLTGVIESAPTELGMQEIETENDESVNVPVVIDFGEDDLTDGLAETPEASEALETVASAVKPATATEVKSSTTVATQTVVAQPKNTITIAGRTLEIVNVNNTNVNAEDHVNRYGKKFLYGHNSNAVFGPIVNLKEGATFTVTIDGVTTKYKVAKTEVFKKNTVEKVDKTTGKTENKEVLQVEKADGAYAGDYMNDIARAKYGGKTYALAIMTCYGQPVGHNDATHRFVIFAEKYTN